MKIHSLVGAFIFLSIASQTLAEQKPQPTTSSQLPVQISVLSTGESIVARVNGTEITRKELDTAVHALMMQNRRRQTAFEEPGQIQNEVLDELIARELLLQEGSQHPGADVDQKTKSQIEIVKKQLGGDEQLKSTLAETGVTMEEYTKRVHDNVIVQETVQELIEKQAKVTAEEAKSYYDKNPEQFKQPETVRASHILIRVPPDATDEVKKEKQTQIEAARSLVKGGEKFADVARKVSEDPGSAANGGDLGFFPRGAMVPEFDAAAFSLATNTVSDVITTQFGYHILLVTDRKPSRALSFDEVKDNLTEYLKQRKANEITRDHVSHLRNTAKVDVLLSTSFAAPVIETPPVAAPTTK